jgi:pimeloyl-ACP methyl ester carboxylesterase
MPHVSVNGIRLAYRQTGEGRPVLLVMGTSAGGRAWTVHQTPALNRAGYQTTTFDNRGIPPSDVPAGRYSLADMVADTQGLIESLGIGPCRLVGTSLGAMIAQELAAGRPDLVESAVLIATRARADAVRRALALADRDVADGGTRPPARYTAATTVVQMFSPATLNDDAAASLWLDAFELSSDNPPHGQYWADVITDQRDVLRRITVPCRVIAFTDDLIAPPHLGAEVADAIPDCDLVEIPRAGHLGFLERPDEVNAAIIEFLDKH